MKYLVQLKYTNPAHEHVSLRRRVDTVNRIVEAATEEEAINRIARQQRALGYLIQEAKVIDSDAKKEKEQLDEAKKPDASLVMRDELKNKMITDKDKQTLGKVAALMASQKKKDVKEEVEQVDEGSKRMSAAVKLQRAFEREQTASDASRKRGEEMRTQAFRQA